VSFYFFPFNINTGYQWQESMRTRKNKLQGALLTTANIQTSERSIFLICSGL